MSELAKIVCRAAGAMLVCLVCSMSLFADDTGAVAMAPWTTDSYSWQKLQAAETLQDLVGAELFTDSTNQWVERSQLDLALKELKLTGASYSDTRDQLRFGQLTGADLLVLGRIETDSSSSLRIRLEIVDLAQADVLTTRLLEVPEEEMTTIATAQRTAETIRTALTEAWKVRRDLKNKTRVALLYFRNAASTGRLDFLQNDLPKQLASFNDGTSNVRIVQFPKASDAISEAELLADGLVASSSDGRGRLADQYVWGEFEEINSSGVPFPEVEVRLKLYRWNGGRQIDQVALQNKVRELPQLFNRAAKWVHEQAREVPVEPHSDETAKKLAEDLYQESQSIQRWILQPIPFNGKLLSPDWLRKWRQSISLLSMAAFFDPSHADARRELVIETTREDIDNRTFPENRGYWRTVQRSRAWAAYVERFGFDANQPSRITLPNQQGSLTDNRLVTGKDSPLKQLVRSAEQRLLCVAPNYETMSQLTALKLDAQHFPQDVVQRWHEEASQDYIDRYALAVRQRPDLYSKRAAFDMREHLRYLATDEQKVEFAEKLWPLIVKHPELRSKTFDRLLRNSFVETGQDDRLQELMAMLPVSETETPRPATPHMPTLQYEPNTVVTPQIVKEKRLSMKSIYIGGRFRDVGTTAVEMADGQLWTAMGARYSSTKYQLLRCDSKTEKIDYVTFRGDNPAIMDLCRHQNRLWIASENLGVIAMGLNGEDLQRFDDRSGLPSSMIYCLAAHGQTVYCGGGGNAGGVIAAYDLRTKQWTAYDLPTRTEGSQRLATPRVEELAFDGKYLACFAHNYGSNATLLVRRVGEDDWTRLDQRLLDEFPQFSRSNTGHRRLMVVDLAIINNVLWIASTEGLLGYDIGQDKFIFAEELPAMLTAMQANEQGLWLAFLPRTDVLPGQGIATGAALLHFDPTTKAWISQTRVPKSGKATSIAIEQGTMALGMGGDGNTVTLIDLP